MLALVGEVAFVLMCVCRPDDDNGAPREPTDPPRNRCHAALQVLHRPSTSSGPGRLEERRTQTDGIKSSNQVNLQSAID